MHQDRLHLVIGVVPHHHTLGLVFTGEIKQKAISAQTGRFFYPKFILQRKKPDILPLAKKRQSQFSHKYTQGICLCGRTLAQSVIQMPDDKFETALFQAMDQAKAIRPT